MNQSVLVSYMHGLGNQFMVIDLLQNQSLRFNQINFKLIGKLLNQSNNYKIDQILILDSPSSNNIDFDYHIFNCDGSIAEQCANGARCIAKFIYDNYPRNKSFGKYQYSLQTNDGKILELEYINDNKIKEVLEPASFVPTKIGLNLSELSNVSGHKYCYQYPKKVANLSESSQPPFQLPINFYSVSLGNPHLVINTSKLAGFDNNHHNFESFDIKSIGEFFQNQKALFKNSVNANFIQIINRDEIKLRTYERGAGETLACGSGACASFACLRADNQVNEKLTIHLPLGSLKLSHLINQKIEMIGPATFQESKNLLI